MAGLTATGFDIKTLATILSEMVADQVANIDADLNTEADSVLGQLNGIYAAALAELWEVVEAVYQASYPDTASGQALSYIAALTGTERLAATNSTLPVNLTFTGAGTLPAGFQVHPEGDAASLYQTTAGVTAVGADTEAATLTAVTPGSASTAASGDTLVIATPNPLISAVAPTDNDTPGRDEETDAELRLRRLQQLSSAATSTPDAIRAEMLTVTGVDACVVFENPTGATDANGLPPHSFEVLVQSINAPNFTAADVVQKVWDTKPAGIQTFGTTSGIAVDDSGNNQTVYYSTPYEVTVHIELEVEYFSNRADALTAQAVKDAIVEWGELNATMGRSIYASDIVDVARGLANVENVVLSSVLVDDVDPAVSTDLTLSARQIASIEEGNIDVTLTDLA